MTDWATTPQPVGDSRWRFPLPSELPDGDIVTVGGDLEPSTIVNAYRWGVFPMEVSGLPGVLGWWSPDPRGIVAPRSAPRHAVDAAEREAIRGSDRHLFRARHPRVRRSVARKVLDQRRLHRGRRRVDLFRLWDLISDGLELGEVNVSLVALASLGCAGRKLDVDLRTPRPVGLLRGATTDWQPPC